MAYTSHGHQIPGTTVEGKPDAVARCGGPKLCKTCEIEAGMHLQRPQYNFPQYNYKGTENEK